MIGKARSRGHGGTGAGAVRREGTAPGWEQGWSVWGTSWELARHRVGALSAVCSLVSLAVCMEGAGQLTGGGPAGRVPPPAGTHHGLLSSQA